MYYKYVNVANFWVEILYMRMQESRIYSMKTNDRISRVSSVKRTNRYIHYTRWHTVTLHRIRVIENTLCINKYMENHNDKKRTQNLIGILQH